MKSIFLIIFLSILLLITGCTSESEKDICTQDSDCIQSFLCGCHTEDYLDFKDKEATKKGIAYDACTHPENSYCTCENNRCIEKTN